MSIIKARAIIPIFYSSVTNTSKKIAYMLQDKLQGENFLSTVTNIGDFDQQQFLQLTGPLVLILSTYGNGGSPADGEEFVQWLRSLEKKNYFQKVELAILGLGNRSFQHFCGNSKTVRELMLHNSAKQVVELNTCNSASNDETAHDKFPSWSDQLIAKLKQKYQLKQINAGDIFQKYKTVVSKQQIAQADWQNNKAYWQPQLSKQFLTYNKSFKAQIIHIKQLRQQNDGRSTLWIRIKTPQNLKLQPACNISVYPQNVRTKQQQRFEGSIKIQPTRKNSKIAYPPLPLQKLWKISNINQIADLNIIKFALAMSKKSVEEKQKYQKFLKNPELLQTNPIRCYQLYEILQPGIDFFVKLGINSVRPYTLASWAPGYGYFDLVAAIDPKGLASRYFSSIPKEIRVMQTKSSFYVPSGRPVVMIANGSGIAPFRSLTEYFIRSSQQNPKLYLYFGIQNKKIDFYFRQEWQRLEKQQKIKLRIAQSRADPNNKVYVQNLIKQDKQFFTKHLFEDKGVIFICGSVDMAKGVDTQIYQAIKVHQPIPFKAFKLSTQLIKNKTIVKQIFD